jgi:hypothetical protein
MQYCQNSSADGRDAERGHEPNSWQSTGRHRLRDRAGAFFQRAAPCSLAGDASDGPNRLMLHTIITAGDVRPGRRKRRDGTSGSGYFQAAQAKLIDCLGTRVSFTLGVHGDLGRQIAELIADVPAALAAI